MPSAVAEGVDDRDNCPFCGGSGEDDDGDECEWCHGTGGRDDDDFEVSDDDGDPD